MADALAVAVAAVALSLPAPQVPETSDRYEGPEARVARLAVVGNAISEAVSRARCEPPWDAIDVGCRRAWPGPAVELAALLLGLAYQESALAGWVHAGRCRVAIGECDAGRARSPWQLQSRTFCSRRAPGQPWLDATIAAYARGYSCTWPRAAARARFVVSLEARIRHEMMHAMEM